MVVAYHELRSGPDVVGAFVAHDDIDPVLKLAEPPDHTRWAEDSGRLRSANDKSLVRGMDNRINRVVEDLRKHLRGETTDVSGSPRQLEEMMGVLFGVQKGGSKPPPPPRPPSNVSVATDSKLAYVNGRARLQGTVRVMPRETYEGGDFDCAVKVRVDVLRQDTRTVDEELAVTLGHGDDDLPGGVSDREPSHQNMRVVRIGRQSVATIDFTSAPFDDYALCQVVVDTEEAAQ